MQIFPVGKLPPDALKRLLSKIPKVDPDIVVGPGLGLDCAIIDTGHDYLVLKSDPITFATDAIGWYAVQVNANDLATTGALPRWMLVTSLLPEGSTTELLASRILDDLLAACQELGISLIGGHTEITSGLQRPILIGTLVGNVPYHRLITPRGSNPGDVILMTKWVPIEGTALLVREFCSQLQETIRKDELERAANYLFEPGISVVKDAQIALEAGRVTAMHDPTEGGVIAALWELAEACEKQFRVNLDRIPVPRLARKICTHFGINLYSTLASGALLLTVHPDDVGNIKNALQEAGIPCTILGEVYAGKGVVDQNYQPIPWNERDELAKVFSNYFSASNLFRDSSNSTSSSGGISG